jgi:hypothetical protein
MAVKYINTAGRASFQLGRGVDLTTGSPLGVAVVPDQPQVDPNNSGQIVNYDVSIIESSEELEESLGLSVGAEMRYGLFSSAGKFEMKEKTQYKSFATYVLAKCDVRNPPIGLFQPSADGRASGMRNLESNFRRAFGDSFVRAALTGGEFYVAIEIVHQDTSVQKSLAASLQAEYNGFIASADLDFQMSNDTKQKASSSQLRIIQYQAAGTGVSTSLVTDAESVIARLKAFPQIVRDNPVAIQVELAPYDTIPDLQVNFVAQANLREWMDDCARKRSRYKQVIDELDFLLTGTNRTYFVNPPSDEIARSWKTIYSRVWNQVMTHAEKLADGTAQAGFVEPPDLPTLRLERVPQQPEVVTVAVPKVERLEIAHAQQELTRLGFVAMPRPRTVASNDTTPLQVVLSQAPPPQTPAPKGSQVWIEYATKPALVTTRFAGQIQARAVNAVRVAQ